MDKRKDESMRLSIRKTCGNGMEFSHFSTFDRSYLVRVKKYFLVSFVRYGNSKASNNYLVLLGYV